MGNFSTKIKSLIVHLVSPSSPLKKKRKKKKLNHKVPLMSKPSSNLFNLCPWRPTQTQARLVNRGSSWEKKGFECQNRSPPTQTPAPQVQQQFSGGGKYLQGRGRMCGRLKGRCTCVASWGSCWLRVTAPPPPQTPRAEALGGPRVPPGVEEVM